MTGKINNILTTTRKNIFHIAILMLLKLILFGCGAAPMHIVRRDVNIRNISHSPIIHTPIIVDLIVEDTKVTGNAVFTGNHFGPYRHPHILEGLRSQAISNALRTVYNADLLVEPVFTITFENRRITVEVTGFPARYANFRSLTEENLDFLYRALQIVQPNEVRVLID